MCIDVAFIAHQLKCVSNFIAIAMEWHSFLYTSNVKVLKCTLNGKNRQNVCRNYGKLIQIRSLFDKKRKVKFAAKVVLNNCLFENDHRI